jgi:hypothetical protein
VVGRVDEPFERKLSGLAFPPKLLMLVVLVSLIVTALRSSSPVCNSDPLNEDRHTRLAESSLLDADVLQLPLHSPQWITEPESLDV